MKTAPPSKGREATQPDLAIAETDLPEEPPESGPLRRCLVTRQQFARESMLRFVVGPGAGGNPELVFDALATLPGRGLWLSADGIVVEQAIKRGVFARAAKTSVRIPPDLRSRIETTLRQRLMDLLGLARRSGNAVSGFEKGRDWVVSGKAGLIVQAEDGSAEERARFIGGKKIPVVTVPSAAALGKIFGRDHTVHAAIASGRLARIIEVAAARLAGVASSATSGQ